MPTVRWRIGASPTRSVRTTTNPGTISNPRETGSSDRGAERRRGSPGANRCRNACRMRADRSAARKIADVASFDSWYDAYVYAMRSVHKANTSDLDVAALLAETIMNRTPWALWDLQRGQPAAGPARWKPYQSWKVRSTPSTVRGAIRACCTCRII